MLKTFLNMVVNKKGRCLLIGGAVIDTLFDREIKDWDVEVYNLTLQEIVDILQSLNLPVNVVGASFGVIKTTIDGVEFDLSVPRTENNSGVGHKDFTIELRPDLTPEEAGRRRDLTINSMYRDMHTNELIDPFNGLEDLEKGILRATDPATFIEDPLRVLRIMQLLPRKGKVVAAETLELCQTMVNEFIHLPKERIFEEFSKLLLKAEKPSEGLIFLKESGWIVHFPELKNLIGCEQNPEWHPEGDVWNHTLLVIDNAAKLRHNLPEEKRLACMFGALLHDIGKPSTTTPELSSPGHAEAGVPLAETFMRRITNETKLIELVKTLVNLHMRPGALHHANAGVSAWKRLHKQVDLTLLGFISKADSAGRTGRSIEDQHSPSELCFQFKKEFPEEIKPILQGRDLIAKGMKPSPAFSEILKKAFELQLDGCEDKDELFRLATTE